MSTIAERLSENRRERQEVNRYNVSDFKKKIIEGEGMAIGEIAKIKNNLKGMRKDNEILILIHKIMFGVNGIREERKKDIVEFKGYKGKDEEETKNILERKIALVARQKYVDLIEICRIFCLAAASVKNTKEKYAEEIVTFLHKPDDKKIVETKKEDVAVVEEEEEEEIEDKKKPKKTVKKGKKEVKETKKPKKEVKEKKGKATPKKEVKKETKEKKGKATPKKEVKKETKVKETKEKKGKATPKKEVKKEKATKKNAKTEQN